MTEGSQTVPNLDTYLCVYSSSRSYNAFIDPWQGTVSRLCERKVL